MNKDTSGKRAKNPNQKLEGFKKTVWSYYRAHKRDMPWRRDTSLYAVVVSEIMLQQTQVSRVMTKFASWIKRFPSWEALAGATTKEVLQEWSGLGYNRRALYLKRIAESAVSDPDSLQSFEKLRELPGIGPNTAGAILAYAYNIPHPFIETNIRSAYIHFFFKEPRGTAGTPKITDAEIFPLIEQTLADPRIQKDPREWHWALMDYGAHIKAELPNPSRRSAHHVRQKPFKGSNRELRSRILQAVMEKPQPLMRDANVIALEREGFIVKKGKNYQIV